MKRITAIVAILCMVLALTSCAGANGGAKGESLKLGMAVVTNLSGADATEEGNGNVQTASTAAAVLLDKDGKIVSVALDVAQSKVEFTTAGAMLDKDAELLTKRQLGDNYGMAKRAEKGEWYKQADGFCAYVVGKTADEVAGIAVNAEGVPTDEALAATTTIKVGDYINAVVKACGNAQELGSVKGDKLGLAIVSTKSGSADASADGDGTAFVESNYSAVTVNADGKVSASIVDATQIKVNVTAAGALTEDVTTLSVLTKNELKEDYGMAKRAEKGEWYKQVEGFCKYINGKSAEEISGIAIDESTKPTDEALKATTTISIGDFLKVVPKAMANAK